MQVIFNELALFSKKLETRFFLSLVPYTEYGISLVQNDRLKIYKS